MSAAAAVKAPPAPEVPSVAPFDAGPARLGPDPACIRCNVAGWREARLICRRNAPPAETAPSPSDRAFALWPAVKMEDWCGEFSPSERIDLTEGSDV